MSRRAFTLIECVLALVILAVAVPATLLMVRDATIARTESVLSTRASWLASMVCEQVLADVASEDPSLGMQALSDPAMYLEAPSNGLYARLDSELADYAALGLTPQIEIGPLVALDGNATGDPQQDLYRRITVNIRYRTASVGERMAPFDLFVTDPTP